MKEKALVQKITKPFRTNVQATMALALAVVWGIFAMLTDGVFIATRNLSNLMVQTCAIGILASGMVLVVVSGNMDLSVGSLSGLIGAICVRLMVTYGCNTFVTIAAAIGVGLLVGMYQGYWVSYKGVPAYVVTLSGMLVWRGLCYAVTGGTTLGPTNPAFKFIGQGYLPSPEGMPVNVTAVLVGLACAVLMVWLRVDKRKTRLKYGFTVGSKRSELLICIAMCVGIAAATMIFASYRGIPFAVVILLAVICVLHFITTKTVFGRHVYACGSNQEAAHLSGINAKKINMMIYVIVGALCAISSIVSTARLNSSAPTAGNMLEMDCIAAAIIGGASTTGGEGTVIGAIIGALFMASLDNGMSLLNLDVAYQYVIKGLVLMLAVYVDLSTRKKGK